MVNLWFPHFLGGSSTLDLVWITSWDAPEKCEVLCPSCLKGQRWGSPEIVIEESYGILQFSLEDLMKYTIQWWMEGAIRSDLVIHNPYFQKKMGSPVGATNGVSQSSKEKLKQEISAIKIGKKRGHDRNLIHTTSENTHYWLSYYVTCIFSQKCKDWRTEHGLQMSKWQKCPATDWTQGGVHQNDLTT